MPPPETSNFQLTEPFLLRGTLGEKQTYRFLDENTLKLRPLALDDLYWQIWRNVPSSAGLHDFQTFNVIRLWSLDKKLSIPPFSLMPPPGLAVPLPTQPAPVLGNPGFTSAIGGLFPDFSKLNYTLSKPPFRVQLDFSGASVGLEGASKSATAKAGPGGPSLDLKAGPWSATASPGWAFDSLELEAAYTKGDTNAKFKAKLKDGQYRFSLGFGTGPEMPDTYQMQALVYGGWNSVVNIYGAASTFRNLSDVGRIKDAIEPHLDPLKDAGEAFGQLADARSGKLMWHFEVGVNGPTPETATPSFLPPQYKLAPDITRMTVFTNLTVNFW